MDHPLTLELILQRLCEGLPGITPEVGAALAQACMVCLHHKGHGDQVVLTVKGAHTRTFCLRWHPQDVTDQVLRTWNDLQEATEDGAACLACLLVLELTEYTIIERSRKKTGFDYWLGRNDDAQLFNRDGRLEVSGILKGTDQQIKKRVNIKVKQTSPTAHLGLPALAIVVEFSNPVAHVAVAA
ncbi:MAG: hypothetical protein WCH05_10510 [Chlorobiaceae bacterium]